MGAEDSLLLRLNRGRNNFGCRRRSGRAFLREGLPWRQIYYSGRPGGRKPQRPEARASGSNGVAQPAVIAGRQYGCPSYPN